MQAQKFAVGGWEVSVWAEPAAPGTRSQDAWAVRTAPGGGVRVVVTDGVTPWHDGPGTQAVMAARTAAVLVCAHGSLADGCSDANAALHDPSEHNSRKQAQSCVAACDLTPSGSGLFVRAGDCEAWVRRAGGAWESVFPEDPRSPGATAELRRVMREAGPHATRFDLHAAEERIMGRPSSWRSAALGRFPCCTAQERRIGLGQVAEVVVASDGARLTAGSLEDLGGWLGGLRLAERDVDAPGWQKRHDDVTVVRAVRLRTGG